MGKKANFRREYNQLLNSQTHFGESKHIEKQKMLKNAKETGNPYTAVKGIYSKTTLKTYQKGCEHYSTWLRANHPEVKRFSQGKDYISEWLESLRDNHSAWTLATYASSVACAYGISKSDICFDFPRRKRENIIRSRSSVSWRDTDSKYEDVITFVKATGARRIGATRVTKNDYRINEDGSMEVFLKEKNGMSGWRKVLPQYQEEVQNIFKKSPGFKIENGELRLFSKRSFPREMHRYRAEYATELYHFYEDKGTYTTGEKYYCRGDMRGIIFDKGILAQVSQEMFHHRLDVVVTNYLYSFKQ